MTTPTLREAAQAALEALEQHAMQRTYAGGVYISNAAIALRAALAQPVPDAPLCHCNDRPATECPGEWEPGCDLGNNPAHVRVSAQPVPDAVPVATVGDLIIQVRERVMAAGLLNRAPLYATPQPAPLTHGQIVEALDKAGCPLAYMDYDTDIKIARAIEAAHGIVPAPTTATGEQR
jgi:hypothetical protein